MFEKFMDANVLVTTAVLIIVVAAALLLGFFILDLTGQGRLVVGQCYKAVEHTDLMVLSNGKSTSILPYGSVDLIPVVCAPGL